MGSERMHEVADRLAQMGAELAELREQATDDGEGHGFLWDAGALVARAEQRLRDRAGALAPTPPAGAEALEETAARVLKALQPLDGILEINGPCFMMLAQEVESSGVAPLELTLADVALMLGKATARYNRMCRRLDELQAEG